MDKSVNGSENQQLSISKKTTRHKPPSRKLRDRMRWISFFKFKSKVSADSESCLQETPVEKEVVVESSPKPIKNLEPQELYRNIEHNMRLSRLEEAHTLITALRHLVRTMHPKGRKITYSVPEAVDRIQLKSSNIPTDPLQLKSLVDEVFKRRDETYSLDELYEQDVMSHGRITFDPAAKWPASHIHTRHP